jgi:hypothetical protein
MARRAHVGTLIFAIGQRRTPALERLESAPIPAPHARENPRSANKWPCNGQLRPTSIEQEPLQVFTAHFRRAAALAALRFCR